ncbi:MAG: hypothetical protein H0X39_17280, partial [Actinobacteria bacterium]|nr:hypothetical protein [Actinomycetota bacterium]
MTDEPVDVPDPQLQPVSPVEDVDPLVALGKERDEYLDALQRLKAEFDNYRKRVARDQQELA